MPLDRALHVGIRWPTPWWPPSGRRGAPRPQARQRPPHQPLRRLGLRQAARLRDRQARSAGSNVKTRSGAVIGTPYYMSPEQGAGPLRRGHRHSDVYSLGSCSEMTIGQVPFTAEGWGEVLLMHTTVLPSHAGAEDGHSPQEYEGHRPAGRRQGSRGRFASMAAMREALLQLLVGPEGLAQAPIR